MTDAELESALKDAIEHVEGISMTGYVRGQRAAFLRFAVIHAESGVLLARTIKDGWRRHVVTKRRRDALRAARKAEAARYR